jgi:hypothetical protein
MKNGAKPHYIDRDNTVTTKLDKMLTRHELEDALSKINRLANEACNGAVKWQELDSLYWEIARVADKMREQEND